ncbi:MAG TPA: preprotein translocase subunit YajC [Rikenellaceae bacterium]|nr:preprotein translocase subunit YajC [Rikenellaceae bacterium]
MNILTLASLLQATAPAGAGQQPQAGGGGMFWIMIIAMFVIMWLFMIRPQRKQQKELEKFRNSLKRGDKVVTAGGIYGTVDEIKDRSVLIKVDGDVKLRVDKNSLVRDFTQDAPQQ